MRNQLPQERQTRTHMISCSARLGIWILLSSCPVAANEISDPDGGLVLLPPGSVGAVELSDIAFLGGTAYRLVSDNTSGGARALEAAISIDSASGTITGAPAVVSELALDAGTDTEGLAVLNPDDFFVSDEAGPAIHRFDGTGRVIGMVAIPDIYTSGQRTNLGLESLALGPDGALWTANEEALTHDGPVSTFTEGTIVRIQQFDASLAPIGQWGYITEPIPGDIAGTASGRDIELSGVVEIEVLPSGTVLVLERAFGGDPGNFHFPVFESRIYEISLTGATETSGLPNLSVGGFTPVTKTLLWEATFTLSTGLADFEGLTVGPALDDGDLSLLLVADDNGGSSLQALYALRITPTLVGVSDPTGSVGPSRVHVYPNPSARGARFAVDGAGPLDRLVIFDARGRRVHILTPNGEGRARWSMKGVAPGTYFVRLWGGEGIETTKLVIAR